MKQRLFTPGPTPVPARVRAAMAEPMMHHRDARFAVILQRVRDNVAWVMGTQSEVVLLAGSGTLGMEASVVNCVAPKDTVLFVNSGKFGARWGEILSAYQVHHVAIDVPLGQAVTVAQVQRAFERYPEAKALCVQACETATGVSHPVQALSALCQSRPDCLCIVDGITHVALEPLPMDAWGVDVLIGATQKSFMMSAGLTLLALSPRAWARAKTPGLPRFYADLPRELAAQSLGHTAWTSAVSLVYGLDVALQMMREEGLPALYQRHRAMAALCQSMLTQQGCSIFPETPAQGLTVVRPPEGIAAQEVIADLREHHGMRIGGGQDTLAGCILRVAHMGDMDLHDVAMVTAAVGEVLTKLASAR